MWHENAQKSLKESFRSAFEGQFKPLLLQKALVYLYTAYSHFLHLNRRRQNCKVLQGALDSFIQWSVLITTISLWSAQSLQLAQIGIEVLLADFFGGCTAPRKPDVLQKSDDVVSQTFVVLVEVAGALSQGLGFLVGEIFTVVLLLFYETAGGYETMCQVVWPMFSFFF